MWPEAVVVLSPGFDERLSFVKGVEDLLVQEFIPELAVEGFDVAVLKPVLALLGSQGLPGSIKSVLTWSRLSQSLTAVEQNSGPLSERICWGGPC